MVANRYGITRYRFLDYFKFDSVCSCRYTEVSIRHELPLSIVNKQIDAGSDIVMFISKPVVFFRSVEM